MIRCAAAGVVARAVLAVAMALLSGCSGSQDDYQHGLTERDLQFLRGFSLAALPPPPPSPGNRFADDDVAARLGQRLFFDTRLSANGAVACASCHQPNRFFTDGLRQSRGVGTTQRNAISLVGSAYGPWKYWDGRKDSLWAQATEPLQHASEHAMDRARLLRVIQKHYQRDYQQVFGQPPEHAAQVLANIGKALEAYQRELRPLPAKFDRFVTAAGRGSVARKNRFNAQELLGLRLFMGRAACASCHNGPLFTNFEFHNIGAPEPDIEAVDLGRYQGIEQLRADEFNCLSRWSDAGADNCRELQFLKTLGPELVGAFKTPSLRNVGFTAPYMQAGQLASLADVVAHYNTPKPPFYDRAQHPARPHFDILPLALDPAEQAALVAFLHTLDAELPSANRWWHAIPETSDQTP